MLSLSGGLWCSFGRPWRRRPAGRGATIAVRSVRSGLPRCQPRTPSASYGFPRAHLHAPRPTGRRRHGLQRDHVTGAGANRVLGVLAADRVGTEDWAGPPKPAARAAFFGIWGEVGRDAEESERQRRRYYVWKNPGCIGCCLPWKGSGMHRALSSVEGSAMHRAFSSRGRIRDASPDIFPVSRSSPVSGVRQARHAQATLHHAPPLSSPVWTAPQTSNPPPARSANTPSQDTA
ncbi:hypothetical protein LMG26841_04617 [Achromobacter dolens]|uniref:Uncharacterized protein n=1 Tax=Achromobacter dolens TaxID=1287738 RepID=A0A6S7EAC6_9BURK|nr:hypothetical protein LMG26841_04617 [Achromobacter dolens]